MRVQFDSDYSVGDGAPPRAAKSDSGTSSWCRLGTWANAETLGFVSILIDPYGQYIYEFLHWMLGLMLRLGSSC